MSKPNDPPRMTGSLVDAAVKEFELVLGRKNKNEDAAALRKGANVRKRNALGRGLSALMSSNTLEVEVLDPAQPHMLRQHAPSAATFERMSTVAGTASTGTGANGAEVDTSANPAEAERSTAPSPSPATSFTEPTASAATAEDPAKTMQPQELSGQTPASAVSLSGGPFSTGPSPAAPLTSVPASTLPASSAAGGLSYIPLAHLVRNPQQPRQYFLEAEIEDLSRSIRQTGLLQPILVRPRSEKTPSGEQTFEIVAGERRFRAAERAGLHAVPALVRELDEREVLEVAIVENVQRSQLNPVEEARAYHRLSEEFELSQDEIAKTVGKDRTTIANALRLLKLSPKVLELLAAGTLSSGHARALLMVQDAKIQLQLAEEAVAHGLSVRAIETRARVQGRDSLAKGPKTHAKLPAAVEPTVTALEDRIRQKLGTKVKLTMSQHGAGELKISFFSAEELEKLLELLEV